MKLTIQNIERIIVDNLPKLDGYTVTYFKTNSNEYKFIIYYYNMRKMILSIERDGCMYSTNYILNQYMFKLATTDGLYKGQWVLNPIAFKTKTDFMMRVDEMVNHILLGIVQSNVTKSINSGGSGLLNHIQNNGNTITI